MRQLLGGAGARIDAHAYHPCPRAVAQRWQLLQKSLRGKDIEHRRLQRHDQAVGNPQRTLQARGVTHLVLDTPAGMTEPQLERALRAADRLLVPLQPSMFDILATEAFLQRLATRRGSLHVGIIGMRVNPRTRAAEQLAHYVGQLGMPVLGYLRDTQNYVQLAALGATLWDTAPARVERDIAQWQPLLDWINC